MSTKSQIYCRCITISEAEHLLDIDTDLIAWDIHPEDGKRLLNSYQITSIVRQAGKLSVVLVHSRKAHEVCSAMNMIEPDYYLTSSVRSDNMLAEIKQSLPNETGLMISLGLPTQESNESFAYEEKLALYQELADILILDTISHPSEQNSFGCSGKTSNWDIAREVVQHCSIPVILAGGLSPKNVHEAIMHVQPWGVDACTALEHPDKSKNIKRCLEFNRVAQSC